MSQQSPTSNIYLSIIIRSRNVADMIGDCLQSIYRQLAKDTQVILVDHGSDDNTVALVKKKFPQVKILIKPNISLANLRRVGVESASGKYIFFVDADQIIGDGLLRECSDILANQDLDALIIAERPLIRESYLQKVIWYERMLMEKSDRGIPRIYRRDFYCQIKADTNDLFMGEDKIAYDTAKKNAAKVTITQRYIFHRDFQYLLPLLKKYINYGKTMHLLANKGSIYSDKFLPFLGHLTTLAVKGKPIIAISILLLKILKMMMLKYGERLAKKL